MDNEATVSNALDSRFFAPLRRRRTRRVGVELEFPVWNRTPGTATDFSAIHEATDDFLSQFPFSAQVRDDNGAIYRATDPATRDELSFDCSYNTLELSFGPDEDINVTHRRFARYYGALQEALGRHGHALTGMGINPRWRENRQEPIGNGRYRMLLHHLKSYSKYGGSPQFHDHPDFGLVFSILRSRSLSPWETVGESFFSAEDGDMLCRPPFNTSTEPRMFFKYRIVPGVPKP